MGRMKGGRVRLKSVKGKRWKKGQSSSSNPETSKHRNAARGKFTGHLAQAATPGHGVALTADALASHDAIQGEKEEELQLNSELVSNVAVGGEEGSSEDPDDAPSVSMSTTSTAFTLIETSHSVFGRVKRLWNSPTEEHREICAVLAAVSEVVKTNGGVDSVTEYFSILVTALESAEDEKSCTAITYLLSLVMPKTPSEVLQARYGTVCKILTDKLSLYEMSNSTSLLKSLVHCLSVLLRAQVGSVWSESSTQRVFQLLLNYTIHPRPKLRKVSQGGVVGILREGGANGVCHPAARLTGTHCLHVMEKGSSETTVLHLLGMLKDCLANLNSQHVKLLCELMLKLISIGNSVVRSSALKTFHGLFSSVVGPQGLTHQDTTTLIAHLYDYQPSVLDAQLLNAWLTVMEAAHGRLPEPSGLELLPKLYTCCVSCLLANKPFVKKTAVALMKNLLKKLGRWCEQERCGGQDASGNNGSAASRKTAAASNKRAALNGNLTNVKAMFRAVEGGLKYKHFSSWNYVLDVLSTFYEVLGGTTACHKFMTKSLMTLCELRDTPGFPYTEQLDLAFGAAVGAMGPRVVLVAVPLNLDLESKTHEFPRSWILPVLKTYVRGTELSYFRDTLMPLAGRLGAKGGERVRAGKTLEAKLYSTLQLQVWSLLPGFCTDPVDLCEALTPDFAKTLGAALEKAGLQIRKIVCQALVQLVSTCQSHDEERSKLARYAKNFLPILFKLYTTPSSMAATPPSTSQDSDERLFLLDCIKTYLSITSVKLVEVQFSRVMEKLRDSELAAIRHLLLDLAVAFSPHLSLPSLSALFNFISPLLDSSDKAVQKKAYGCLEVVLSGSSPAHQQFLEEHTDRLRILLVDSLSTVAAGSKKPRLRCLLLISKNLPEGGGDFIERVLPEVILCLKEVNEKARALATKLVKSLGYSSQNCFGADCTQEESVKKYFMLVLAGLAGSPRMVSCSLLALSLLVYEFRDLLGTELIQRLVSSILTFLSSQRREVVRSALVLVKITIGVLPRDDLEPHVESLVKRILSWGESKRNHFRLKSRGILERLVRKFDLAMVASLVPKKHQKLLQHIRKTTERRRRRRLEEREQRQGVGTGAGEPVRRKGVLTYEELLESSDEEGEEDVGGARRPPLARKKGVSQNGEGGRGKAWIKEGADDEPVNFMDPVVVKRVLASNPAGRAKAKRARPRPFETDSEGKLVITDDGEGGASSEQAHSRIPSSREGEEEMEVDQKPPSRKRQRRVSEDDDEGEENRRDSGRSKSRGSGIYRANPHEEDFKAYGAEYKAKRAKGDVKKKGQLEPYAYIPLNRQKLNRRMRKTTGEFSGIMKKAMKGSAAGSKQYRKKRHVTISTK